MKIIKYLLGFFGCIVFTTQAISQSSYLCIPDLSTGFSYQKSTNKWISTDFNIQGTKYILSKKNDGIWEWKDFGQKDSLIRCPDGFNESGYINCISLHRIQFNRTNLRFQLIYPIGYTNKDIIGKEGEDTPHMQIGKCSPL